MAADPLSILNERRFCGVFQFGGAVRSYASLIRFESFDDIVAILSLARPGPMDAGAADKWVRRKNGQEHVTFLHPSLETILGPTYGLPIFQEQVMQIAREIGGMTWEDVTGLRRAIGKSQGPRAMERYEQTFKTGARQKIDDPLIVNRVWHDLLGFGAYGFNKSHAVAYAEIAYQCCKFKAEHPVEFAAATLDAEKDPQNQIALLRELAMEGVDYVPVDPTHSTDKWTPATKDGRRVLVGPLTQIKGIGPSTVQEIMDCRRTGKPLRATLQKRLANAKTEIDTLFPIRDAVARLHPDLGAVNIVTTPTPIIHAQSGTRGEIVMIGVASAIKPIDENEPARVVKRGRQFSGPTAALNLHLRDDTDEIFCKIDRYNFERLAKPIIERGRPNKALYAVKGEVWPGFRGVGVTAVKFLGFMDD